MNDRETARYDMFGRVGAFSADFAAWKSVSRIERAPKREKKVTASECQPLKR